MCAVCLNKKWKCVDIVLNILMFVNINVLICLHVFVNKLKDFFSCAWSDLVWCNNYWSNFSFFSYSVFHIVQASHVHLSQRCGLMRREVRVVLGLCSKGKSEVMTEGFTYTEVNVRTDKPPVPGFQFIYETGLPGGLETVSGEVKEDHTEYPKCLRAGF